MKEQADVIIAGGEKMPPLMRSLKYSGKGTPDGGGGVNQNGAGLLAQLGGDWYK